jgi:hypothetical protein
MPQVACWLWPGQAMSVTGSFVLARAGHVRHRQLRACYAFLVFDHISSLFGAQATSKVKII